MASFILLALSFTEKSSMFSIASPRASIMLSRETEIFFPVCFSGKYLTKKRIKKKNKKRKIPHKRSEPVESPVSSDEIVFRKKGFQSWLF